MTYPSRGPVCLRTNLADYPVTKALKEGRVSSPLIDFDFCGPRTAQLIEVLFHETARHLTA